MIDRADGPDHPNSDQGTVFSTSTTNDKALRFFEGPSAVFHDSKCPNVLHVDETPGPYQEHDATCDTIGSVAGKNVYRIVYRSGGPAAQEIFTTRANVFIAFVIPAADTDLDKGPILDFVRSFKPVQTKDLSAWLAKNAQTMAEINKQVDDYQNAVKVAPTKLGITLYEPTDLTSEWQSYLGSNKRQTQVVGQSPSAPQAFVLQYETILPNKHDQLGTDATANLSIIEYDKAHFNYVNGKCGPAPNTIFLPVNAGDGEMIDCTLKNSSYVSSLPAGDMPYREFRVIGNTVIMLELSTTSSGGNGDLSPAIINSFGTIIGQLHPIDPMSIKSYTFYKYLCFKASYS